MTLNEFAAVEIDDIQEEDIRNGNFMDALIGNYDWEPSEVPQVPVSETLGKAIGTFKLYNDNSIIDKLNHDIEESNIDFLIACPIPYFFNMDLFSGKNKMMVPTILCPTVFDKTSYVFFGHELHSSLKNVNVSERKIKDRLDSVIPMFYERVCADNEMNDEISKEILRRRLVLLQLDKETNKVDLVTQLQYFNSYYYSLVLYKRYKEDKLIVLRLISRVLHGEMNTLELLERLNIYGKDFDYVVSRELEEIKQYVLK